MNSLLKQKYQQIKEEIEFLEYQKRSFSKKIDLKIYNKTEECEDILALKDLDFTMTTQALKELFIQKNQRSYNINIVKKQNSPDFVYLIDHITTKEEDLPTLLKNGENEHFIPLFTYKSSQNNTICFPDYEEAFDPDYQSLYENEVTLKSSKEKETILDYIDVVMEYRLAKKSPSLTSGEMFALIPKYLNEKSKTKVLKKKIEV